MKRSGIYKKINVLAIKEGELIKYDPLSEELEVNLIEDDEIREQTPTIGYYAMFEEKNGFKKTMYWSKKKMIIHADTYSMAFNKESYKKLLDGKIPEKDMWKYSSYWYKDFDGMAYKTMLRQLISKWGTMSIDMQDMQDAYTKDMAEIKENGDFNYIENSDETDINNIVETQAQENQTDQEETPVTTNDETEKSTEEQPKEQPKEIGINSVDEFFN